jgi:hypothetical protein
MIVAFTLLSSVLSLSLPLVVRHGRLLSDGRAYRIALDELSNQMDMLMALQEAEVPAALGRLAPSEFAATRLPGARIVGELAPADIGQRLLLRISWKGLHPREITMVGWVLPRPGSIAQQQGEE